MNVLLAILILSIIIIVHEFGHYVIAKANGITVVEFSIGFGPKLLHYKKGETDYCIKLLPFGGACTMLGDEYLEMTAMYSTDEDEEEIDGLDEEEVKEKREEKKNKIAMERGYDMNKSFSAKSVWARIAVIAAGPIFNFILAFIFSVVIVGLIGYDPCDIDVVDEDSPAYEAGLREGDVITNINGNTMEFARDYDFYAAYYADEPMKITYKRDGKKYTTTITPEKKEIQKYQVGIALSKDCVIENVVDDMPAKEAGIKNNDILVAINGNKSSDAQELVKIINECNGENLVFTVLRDGKEKDLSITPKFVEMTNYYTGFQIYGDRIKVSPSQTILQSFKEVGYGVRSVIASLRMLFTGKIKTDALMGPVGTVTVMSEVVEQSRADGSLYVFINLFYLGALISANLGVMNLLPIPALDGGRLVFLIIEAVRGKPVKKEHEGIVTFIGMVLLVLLMAYVLVKDVARLF